MPDGTERHGTIRVLVVDHQEIVRRGIAQVLADDPELVVAGESTAVRGTLGIVARTRPHVVVLDAHLPDGSGIDLCRRIRSAEPGIRCLILTDDDDETAALAAVIGGAAGYLRKSVPGHQLLADIRRAARGELLLPPEATAQVRAKVVDPEHAPIRVALTLRERQALELITDGLTNREIGARLGITEQTVKNYVSGLLAKLGMQRRSQVAAYGATERARDDDDPQRSRR